MKAAFILAGIALLYSFSTGAAALNCNDVLEKAPADAKPKFKSLPSAAVEGDMQSACLLLKAGKTVDSKNK
jgi:hypothetical protein